MYAYNGECFWTQLRGARLHGRLGGKCKLAGWQAGRYGLAHEWGHYYYGVYDKYRNSQYVGVWHYDYGTAASGVYDISVGSFLSSDPAGQAKAGHRIYLPITLKNDAYA